MSMNNCRAVCTVSTPHTMPERVGHCSGVLPCVSMSVFMLSCHFLNVFFKLCDGLRLSVPDVQLAYIVAVNDVGDSITTERLSFFDCHVSSSYLAPCALLIVPAIVSAVSLLAYACHALPRSTGRRSCTQLFSYDCGRWL